MARATSDAVAAIIEVDGAINLAPFIAVANALTNEVADSYDEDRLTLIETWLSAHFYATRDPRAEMEKAGPVSVKYQSSVEVGINNTQYGQAALALDTKGVLRALVNGKRRTLSVSWMGKTMTEVEQEVGQQDYEAGNTNEE